MVTDVEGTAALACTGQARYCLWTDGLAGGSGGFVHVTAALQPLLPKKAGPARGGKISLKCTCGEGQKIEHLQPAWSPLGPDLGWVPWAPRAWHQAGTRRSQGLVRSEGEARPDLLLWRCILDQNLKILAQHPVASEFLTSCLVDLSTWGSSTSPRVLERRQGRSEDSTGAGACLGGWTGRVGGGGSLVGLRTPLQAFPFWAAGHGWHAAWPCLLPDCNHLLSCSGSQPPRARESPSLYPHCLISVPPSVLMPSSRKSRAGWGLE